jgi:osmoprotectant transport system ATP-binding protein
MVRDFVGADRALKRLRVTPIDVACLEHPPTVTPDAPVADARRAIEQTGAGWAAVVDANGVLRGYVDESHLDGDGAVTDHIQRIETWMPIDGDLQDALATMLLTRVGWVSVLDGDRFVGVLTPEAVYRTLRQSLDEQGSDGAGNVAEA